MTDERVPLEIDREWMDDKGLMIAGRFPEGTSIDIVTGLDCVQIPDPITPHETRKHVLVIELDRIEQAKLDAGEYVLPEHPDSRAWRLICPGGDDCVGWTECREDHICEHGCNARDGFEENDPDGKECPGFRKKLPELAIIGYPDEWSLNCWEGKEEFEFHGVAHTYRHGWGWTMPFKGCIVAEIATDPPDGWNDRSRGEYRVDEDWFDEDACYLDFIDDPEVVAP